MQALGNGDHSQTKLNALALIEPVQAEHIQHFIQNNAVHRLWSPKKYHHATRELSDLLTTPFMLSVVLKVIPGLAEASVDEQAYKEHFIRLLCDTSRHDCITELEAEKCWSQVKPYLIDPEVKVRGHHGDGLDTVQRKYDVDHVFLLKKEDFDREIGEVLEGVRRRLTKDVKVASNLAKQEENVDTSSNELTKKEHPLANFRVDFVMNTLTQIFQPKPIVRYDLYQEFVSLLLNEEIQKLTGRKYGDEPMLASDMYNDLSQYSHRLALKMVQHGVARVNYQVAGKLFRESNEWDVFFKPEGQRKADVMRAAPVKGNNGSYAFIHKSLQEYFVAEVLYNTVMAYPALTDTLLIGALLQMNYQVKQGGEIDVTPWQMDTPEQREAYVEKLSGHELVKRRGRSADHIRNFVLQLDELFDRFKMSLSKCWKLSQRFVSGF